MNEVSSIIYILFQIYYYMILVYILMSWLPNLRENFIGELLGKLVEPYLAPFGGLSLRCLERWIFPRLSRLSCCALPQSGFSLS